MAKVTHILQGVNDRDFHSDRLREILSLEGITGFLISVAFCRSEGVAEIEELLDSRIPESHIFLGIRNEITSAQGIVSLLAKGLNPMVIDTATPSVLFHPKLYASWSESAAKVMLGSANLTAAGLTRNIESSCIFEIDRTCEADEKLFGELTKSTIGLPERFPDHVFVIDSPRQVVKLLKQGRLADERRAAPVRAVRASGEEGERKLPPIPVFRTKPKGIERARLQRQARKSNQSESNSNYVLVWKSKPLTRRSLNIPESSDAHPTGDINLGAGLMKGLDFRHYFRDVAFERLHWKTDPDSQNPFLERADLNFELVVKGISEGVFTVEITHDPRTDTRSYEQNNVMTKIKWGDARPYISREDLLNRTLSILKNDRDEFIIEID